MEETSNLAEAHDLAAEIVMIEYATRSYTDPIGSIKIPGHLKNMVFEWRAPRRTTARGASREASNLVNRETGEFYTPEELEHLIRQGFDISTLDPARRDPLLARQAGYLRGRHRGELSGRRRLRPRGDRIRVSHPLRAPSSSSTSSISPRASRNSTSSTPTPSAWRSRRRSARSVDRS